MLQFRYVFVLFTGHDVVMLAEIKKLAEVIPLGILACKFYENKGVDIDNYSNYKFNDKMNLFDVFFVEN